jgi:hypothetical protein
MRRRLTIWRNYGWRNGWKKSLERTMSNYIKKPHGMMIGRSNNFFYRDEDGDMRDFPCIVGISVLYFNRYSSLHAGIRSTAEQLLFDSVLVADTSLGDFKFHKTMYRLRPYWIGWLDENCPGWGYPPVKHADSVPSIFFSMYRHAKAFTEHVAYFLEGERYLHD